MRTRNLPFREERTLGKAGNQPLTQPAALPGISPPKSEMLPATSSGGKESPKYFLRTLGATFFCWGPSGALEHLETQSLGGASSVGHPKKRAKGPPKGAPNCDHDTHYFTYRRSSAAWSPAAQSPPSWRFSWLPPLGTTAGNRPSRIGPTGVPRPPGCAVSVGPNSARL